MTNKEILQANLLDIVFENRNKSYGAYALRKTYSQRMLLAMGIASSLILLFVLLSSFKKPSANEKRSSTDSTRIVEIVDRYIPPPVQPEQPRQITQPAARTATEMFVNNIQITADPRANTKLPSFDDLALAKPGDETFSGKIPTGIPQGPPQPPVTGTGPVTTVKPESNFTANEKEAEYPGGSAALRKYLEQNLATPDELEAGEKKTVLIRFKVGADGKVSGFEILTSAGDKYDNEVIRVCKKMPKWKPAHQNGFDVTSNYVIPVTFIGVEQ